MAKPKINREDIAGLMGSPNGPDFDRARSEKDASFGGGDFSGEGSTVTSIEGPSVTANHEASRTDRPMLTVRVSKTHEAVPLNMPKVYGDWRATQGKIGIGSTGGPGKRSKAGTSALTSTGELPHWHELRPEEQADWQQTHPDGKRLTKQAIRKATSDPESMYLGEDAEKRKRLMRLRHDVKNMVAEPNSDPSEMSQEKDVPLRQMFEKTGTLLTGKYIGGGTSANNPPERLDPTPEVSLGRAWVANVTSRPEINMALHDDSTHHENMRNAVDSLMQEHAQTVGGAAYGSEVAKHGRLALEAVARSARAHSLGMKTTATANMSQAVRHVHDLSKAVQGAQMSAGLKVTSPMHPSVMTAGKAYGDYNASVANVKGLPE
jgi:hypothetical protein